ncbi:MAG TPA: Cro/CI family transcriptional regulator [Pseudolabrys sp.]|nr:Cro/CI family transcriptional regulator [Pseudolabrys sp.]
MTKALEKVVREAIAASPEYRGKDGRVSAAGTGAALAAHLGITRGAIFQWDEIPVERVVAVEKITGIPRDRLRPDVFGSAA